jgi:AraC-like DNA-binding protein
LVDGELCGHWLRRGVDQPDCGKAGEVRFHPVDGEQQTFIGQSVPGCRLFSLTIPATYAVGIAESEGRKNLCQFWDRSIREDREIQKSVARLATLWPQGLDAGCSADEAARLLILRLVELSGGGTPSWLKDKSVFDSHTLHYLLEYVDAHLKIGPSLDDIAFRVGLSPSHFAKKFRQSTGLSLQRFVNRRRIQASLELLRDQSHPLAHIAFEMGFASQSHFTLLFREVTGMTPSKFRKQVRPAIG